MRGGDHQTLFPRKLKMDTNNNDLRKLGARPAHFTICDGFYLGQPFMDQLIDQLAQIDHQHPSNQSIIDQSPSSTIDNEEDVDFSDFGRFRSKSEGSMLRKPNKGVLRKPDSPPRRHATLPRHVSFADSSGFELAHVHLIRKLSAIAAESEPLTPPVCTERPTLFKTATTDHHQDSPKSSHHHHHHHKRFTPRFTLPWSEPGKHRLLQNTLQERNVCLESLSASCAPWKIVGHILVKNLSHHKRVFVRYTLDDWATREDVNCEYICSLGDGNADRFRFSLKLAYKLPIGTRVQMALGYVREDTGEEYWDSNEGKNYEFVYEEQQEKK